MSISRTTLFMSFMVLALCWSTSAMAETKAQKQKRVKRSAKRMSSKGKVERSKNKKNTQQRLDEASLAGCLSKVEAATGYTVRTFRGAVSCQNFSLKRGNQSIAFNPKHVTFSGAVTINCKAKWGKCISQHPRRHASLKVPVRTSSTKGMSIRACMYLFARVCK